MARGPWPVARRPRLASGSEQRRHREPAATAGSCRRGDLGAPAGTSIPVSSLRSPSGLARACVILPMTNGNACHPPACGRAGERQRGISRSEVKWGEKAGCKGLDDTRIPVSRRGSCGGSPPQLDRAGPGFVMRCGEGDGARRPLGGVGRLSQAGCPPGAPTQLLRALCPSPASRVPRDWMRASWWATDPSEGHPSSPHRLAGCRRGYGDMLTSALSTSRSVHKPQPACVEQPRRLGGGISHAPARIPRGSLP